MAQPIYVIATHPKTHIDEELGILLLRDYGEEKYPGIKDAEVVYWQPQGEEVRSKSAADYEKEGILLIGIGGGRFDEHPDIGQERKNDECAATLVAKDLGLEDEPWLETTLRFVKNNDLKGSAHPFDLASMTKILHESHSPEDVRNWLFVALRAKIQEQMSFFGQTRDEFEKFADVREMFGPHGKTYTVVFVESDDNQMGKFARSKFGVDAALVVQRRSTGHTQIWTNARHKLVLYDIVQMIRLGEQKLNGGVRTSDWKTLASEGKVDGVEEWFFHKEGQMLLNGSLTAPDISPTKLSLDMLKEIVEIGINPNLFAPKFTTYCGQGKCLATPKAPCPWYSWGLNRCRTVRFGMKNK